MERKRLFILGLLVLTVVAVIPVFAITWGEPDGGEHPHVGTLLFVQNGIGYFSCTGTLIAPRVLLTAGHCVESEGNLNDITYVRFDDDALSGIGNYDTLPEWFANDWLAVETVIPHPLYDDYSEFPYTYDLGVVILAEPYTPAGDVFGTLPDLGFLETLRGREKNNFTVVGYGVQSNLPHSAQDDYEKYKGTVRLIEAKSYLTAGGEASAKYSDNPGIGGGTCYGDSGGPVFFADTSIVTSVTSFGWAKNGTCVGNSYYYRTDTSDAQNFINDILAQYSE